MIIVFGGTFFIVMMKMPMGVFVGHFKALAKAFKPSTFDLSAVVERMVELAGVARKDGMMALEGQQVPDRFFERGLQMLIDGADEARLVKALKQEIRAMKARHEGNHSAIKAWIDYGPAMGMIGTWRPSRPSANASSWMATAKSYQLATPASVQWNRPDCPSSAQMARARLAAWVGVPIWSATTRTSSRSAIRRSMVRVIINFPHHFPVFAQVRKQGIRAFLLQMFDLLLYRYPQIIIYRAAVVGVHITDVPQLATTVDIRYTRSRYFDSVCTSE